MAIARTSGTAGRCRAGALSRAPCGCVVPDPDFAPKFWFVAFIDFAIHITVDRLKGIIASRCGVTLENEHPWFWTLIGVDQALHHLTGFGLSIFMAAN